VYLEWFKLRGQPLPVIPKQLILVAIEDTDEVIGGVCVYPTEGPWMFLEHLSFKPGLQKSLILRGVYLGVEAARGMGAAMGKRPLIHSSHKSIDAMLERCRYTRSPMTCWYAEPTTKESPREDGVNSRASRRDETITNEQDEDIMPEVKKKIKRVSARRAKAMDTRTASGDERDSGQQG
jgi:hypothetical protein